MLEQAARRFIAGFLLGLILLGLVALPYAFGNFLNYVILLAIGAPVTGLLLVLLGDKYAARLLVWFERNKDRLP